MEASSFRCTDASEEAYLVSGTTWGSYSQFILVLPVPKSLLEFIGAIQRQQKKGDCGQTCTQIRASLLKRSFSLPVVLTEGCFVAAHEAGDLLPVFSLTKTLHVNQLFFPSSAILLRGRFPSSSSLIQGQWPFALDGHVM